MHFYSKYGSSSSSSPHRYKILLGSLDPAPHQHHSHRPGSRLKSRPTLQNLFALRSISVIPQLTRKSTKQPAHQEPPTRRYLLPPWVAATPKTSASTRLSPLRSPRQRPVISSPTAPIGPTFCRARPTPPPTSPPTPAKTRTTTTFGHPLARIGT